MFMGKKRKAVMLGVNVFLVLALLWSVVFTVDRKNADYTNTDIERYKSLNTIPKLGAVTNSRTAEIRFSLYDEKLYGIALFFYASGEDTDGEIVCSLKHEGETISKQTVSVKELFALINKNEIKPKELILGNGEVCNGDYTLEIKGNGISPQTRISLYGNKADEYFLDYTNANYQNYNGILYIVETLEPERPYIWACAFLLAMSFVFSLIICMNEKEKEHE